MGHPLSFGIYMAVADPPDGRALVARVAEAREEAELAEQCGFDVCLVGEHHQDPDGFLPSPFLLLAAIAARTRTLRLGTGVLLLPLQHPFKIAEDGATLDVISDGRAVLGAGVGYQPRDFAPFGVPLKERGRLSDEALEIIRACWTEERVSYDGRHFTLDGVSLRPRPVQRPHPPIWVGGWTAQGLERAARLGDAWVADPIQHLAVVRPQAAAYRAAAERHGRRPRTILMRDAWVAPTRREAVEEAAPHLLGMFRYYWRNRAFVTEGDPVLEGVTDESQLAFERLAEDRVFLGSPEDCAEQIRRWQEAIAPDGVVLRLRQAHASGPPHAKIMTALKTFGEEIIGRFR
jgi:probable F420-dependent oxidoreductase